MPKPSGYRPEQVAAMLSRSAGTRVEAKMVEEDVASGAPTEPDGTINIIMYVAWLLKQVRDGRY